MGKAAKQTRENRTVTVDFRDEATYFQLLGDGKAFLECVLAFLLALAAYPLAAANVSRPLVSRLKSLHQPVVRARIRLSALRSRLLACLETCLSSGFLHIPPKGYIPGQAVRSELMGTRD